MPVSTSDGFFRQISFTCLGVDGLAESGETTTLWIDCSLSIQPQSLMAASPKQRWSSKFGMTMLHPWRLPKIDMKSKKSPNWKGKSSEPSTSLTLGSTCSFPWWNLQRWVFHVFSIVQAEPRHVTWFCNMWIKGFKTPAWNWYHKTHVAKVLKIDFVGVNEIAFGGTKAYVWEIWEFHGGYTVSEFGLTCATLEV